jgi:hypothetical protein
MKLTAADLATFYNTTFFDQDGQPVTALVQLSLQNQAGERIELPAMEIATVHGLREIFRSAHDYLIEEGPVETHTEPAVPDLGPINELEEIEYRKNLYFLEVYAKEIVVRKADGRDVVKDGPVRNAILKKYRQQVDAKKQE